MSTVQGNVTGKRPPVSEPRRSKKPGGRCQKALKARAASETMSVPEAGKKYFGLSRNGSYAAADRGEIPTIPIGKLRRVPVRLMERMLDKAGEHDEAAA
jgi:hypothetical protein